MTRQLNLDGDAAADRMTLFLPAKFAKAQSSNIWKLLRSMAEVFGIVTTGIDELFAQTNINSASGDYLTDYVNELTDLGRQENETDADFLVRYYRNVFEYNGTRNGMKMMVYDIMGFYPTALVDNEPGAFADALYYFNDINGGSHYGNDSGEPFTGYILLESAPTATQLDEICAVINRHKALGVKIYLKYRKYQILSGLPYAEIAKEITGQPFVKNATAPVGDYYDGRGYFNDDNYPALYGDELITGATQYLFLKDRPLPGVLDELLENLAENLVPGDTLKLVVPEV